MFRLRKIGHRTGRPGVCRQTLCSMRNNKRNQPSRKRDSMSARYQLACLMTTAGLAVRVSVCPRRSGMVFVLARPLSLPTPDCQHNTFFQRTELNGTPHAARGITLAINPDPSFSLTRQLYLDDHVHELTATRKYPEQQKSEQQLGKTKKKTKKKILKSKKHCFFCLASFIQPSAIQKSILQERKSYF